MTLLPTLLQEQPAVVLCLRGTKTLDAPGVNYEGTRRTEGFTRFEPPERITLRPRENESCIAVCCSNVGLTIQS
jgi:hypothetical protein